MDFSKSQAFIEAAWDGDIISHLKNYIAIPAESPAFDPKWQEHGYLDDALDLLSSWARVHLEPIAGATVETMSLPGGTASIFVDIPGDDRPPVLIYGHYDKQPPMEGWHPDKGAWTPVVEGDRLYGRGGADDGYAIFAAITAVRAVDHGAGSFPPVKILIEGSEESGSGDLGPTLDLLGSRLGSPGLVIALDGPCGNYDQLWTTTSLRGQVAGTLRVRTMREAAHSGDASGVAPAAFRIARQLLTRIEDVVTGEIADVFHVPIPAERQAQAVATSLAIGQLHRGLPLSVDTTPVIDDPVEQLLNRAWRPQLAITGIDGVPSVADAAAVFWPTIALKVSLRIPPTLNAADAGSWLQTRLEADPPYGCEVSFSIDMEAQGWEAPSIDPDLADVFDQASRSTFGKPAATIGGGGGIPFLAMFSERFPGIQFIVTGVLGPESNAHGPNEFLHLPAARKLTSALAYILHHMKAA
jgi:acetylornithine deacetylase/succinyl-diaminopimelate desuccinylase-like protein